MDKITQEQIKKILLKYSTDQFYLQCYNFSDPRNIKNSFVYKQVNDIINKHFTGTVSYSYDGYMVVARKCSGDSLKPEDLVLGVGIVNNEGTLDFYNNKIFDYVEPVRKAGMKETYLQYLATDPEYQNLNGYNNSKIKGVGRNILECIKELSRLDGKDAVTLFSRNNEKLINFYNRHGLHSVFENGLMAINNYELESLGIINANIINYMSTHGITSFDEFIKHIKQDNYDTTLLTKGCKNQVPGVIKEMTTPINLDTNNQAQKILNINKVILGEIMQLGTEHEMEDPEYASQHIDMFSELLVINMDMKGELPEEVGGKLPYNAANYLKEKHGDRWLPLVNKFNPYLRNEDTIVKQLNNREIIACAKILKSTQVNYQALFEKEKCR